MIGRKTGFLFEPEDNAEMVCAVQRLINTQPLYTNMSKASRKRAETFSWNNILDELLADYG